MFINKQVILNELGISRCYYNLNLKDQKFKDYNDNQLLYFCRTLLNCMRHYHVFKNRISKQVDQRDYIWHRFLTLSNYEIVNLCINYSVVDCDNIFTSLLNQLKNRHTGFFDVKCNRLYRRIIKMIDYLDQKKKEDKNQLFKNLIVLLETDDKFATIIYKLQHNQYLSQELKAHFKNEVWRTLDLKRDKIPVKMYDHIFKIKKR